MSEQGSIVLTTVVQSDSLWQLIEKMVAVLTGDGSLTKVTAGFHGMKVLVYTMGPGRIRIDLNE